MSGQGPFQAAAKLREKAGCIVEEKSFLLLGGIQNESLSVQSTAQSMCYMSYPDLGNEWFRN